MTNEDKKQYIVALKGKVGDGLIRQAIRDKFGVKKSRANEIYRELFSSAVPPTEEFRHDTQLSNIDEVVKELGIDTKEWTVSNYRVENRHNKDKGDYFSFAISVKRNSDGKLGEALLKTFIDQLSKESPKKFNCKKVEVSDRVLEIPIMDLHLSRLCWNREVGVDYDIKIAQQVCKDSVYSLARHARDNDANTILLICGNDYFDSDNAAGTTHAGTPMAANEDSRWQKTFTTGCELLSEIIETLSEDFRVILKIVPGNHDLERSYYLGAYVSAYFRNNENVEIDNEPTQRKYFRFGQNLILFTHGCNEKTTDLPLIMATERKSDWAETKYRECHTGHLHHDRSKEINGVKIRTIPSLVAQDSYSVSKGWVGNIRQAQAFLYDFEEGLVATYYHNVESV